MKKNKVIKMIKNYRPPKIVMIFILILPALIILNKNDVIDNDIWFLLNHGRYVFQNGFPSVEPFSIHEGLSFVMQQWLSASIFWIIYKYLGEFGLRFFVFIITLLIMFVIYKICMLLSNKKFYLSCFISLIIGLLMLPFFTTRPQIFTFMVLLIEVYSLELYIKTENVKYLFFLPILSLLEINLHSSMWFMLFAFILPYIIDSFKIKLGFISGEGHKKKPLFLITLIMLFVGFINPYGIKAITYIFNSYGVAEINELILEMRAIDITSLLGKIYFIAIFTVMFIYIFHNSEKKHKLRYFLFFCGTLYLALSTVKGVPYFLMMGVIPVSYYINDSRREVLTKKYPRWFEILCILIFFIVFLFNFLEAYKKSFDTDSYALKGATDFILENYDKKNIKVYTDYNDGGYTEFYGIKSYIDPRAEVFIKNNNKKEDIFLEFYNLCKYKIECSTFLEKYKFDLLVLNDKSVLNSCANDKYEQVYKDSYRSVLERKK